MAFLCNVYSAYNYYRHASIYPALPLYKILVQNGDDLYRPGRLCIVNLTAGKL